MESLWQLDDGIIGTGIPAHAAVDTSLNIQMNEPVIPLPYRPRGANIHAWRFLTVKAVHYPIIHVDVGIDARFKSLYSQIIQVIRQPGTILAGDCASVAARAPISVHDEYPVAQRATLLTSTQSE